MQKVCQRCNVHGLSPYSRSPSPDIRSVCQTAVLRTDASVAEEVEDLAATN